MDSPNQSDVLHYIQSIECHVSVCFSSTVQTTILQRHMGDTQMYRLESWESTLLFCRFGVESGQ